MDVVNFIRTPNRPQEHDEDIVSFLLWLPFILTNKKFFKYLTRFIFTFLTLQAIFCYYALFYDFEKAFFIQYGLVNFGWVYGYSNMAAIVFRGGHLYKVFWEYGNTLRPLKVAGRDLFQKMRDDEEFARKVAKHFLFLSLIGAIGFAPIFGDEEDIYLTAMFASKHLGPMLRPVLLFTFYFSFFVSAYCMITQCFLLYYVGLHTKFQVMIMQKRLRELWDLPEEDVFVGLVEIAKHHYRLKKLYTKINETLFYIYFSYMAGVVIFIVALFFFIIQQVSPPSNLRMAFILIISGHGVWLYSKGGEMVAVDTESIFTAICELPWYEWGKRTNYLVQILMMNTEKPLQFSCGLITIRVATVITFFRAIYSTVMFTVAKGEY